jgi:hypothetical protein
MKNKTENKSASSLAILKVRRTRSHVIISYRNGDEEHPNVRYRDNPLPAFDRAITALAPIVLEVLHLPPTYGTENFKCTGLTVSDSGGNVQVTLVAQKQLPECNGPLNLATPLRLLDEPIAEGAVGKPLNDVQADAVNEVIEQAKAYVRGERAQGQIPLEDAEGEDEGDPADNEDTAENNPDQSKLPLAAPEMEHNQNRKPETGYRKGRKGKQAAANDGEG